MTTALDGNTNLTTSSRQEDPEEDSSDLGEEEVEEGTGSGRTTYPRRRATNTKYLLGSGIKTEVEGSPSPRDEEEEEEEGESGGGGKATRGRKRKAPSDSEGGNRKKRGEGGESSIGKGEKTRKKNNDSKVGHTFIQNRGDGRKKPWQGIIYVDENKRKSLGSFETPEEALEACEKAVKDFGSGTPVGRGHKSKKGVGRRSKKSQAQSTIKKEIEEEGEDDEDEEEEEEEEEEEDKSGSSEKGQGEEAMMEGGRPPVFSMTTRRGRKRRLSEAQRAAGLGRSITKTSNSLPDARLLTPHKEASAVAARCVAAAAALLRGTPPPKTSSTTTTPAPSAISTAAMKAFEQRVARVSSELQVTQGTVVRPETLIAKQVGGLERLPLEDDGSCLFQAYVVAAAPSVTVDVQSLRQIVADGTTENELECYQAQSALVPFLHETLTQLEVKDLPTLKKAMVNPLWYGDEHSMKILSEYLGMNVLVAEGGLRLKDHKWPYNQVSVGRNYSKTMVLLLTGADDHTAHYDLVGINGQYCFDSLNLPHVIRTLWGQSTDTTTTAATTTTTTSTTTTTTTITTTTAPSS